MTPGFTRNTRCLLSNQFLHLCVTTVIPSFSPPPLLPARKGLSLYCMTTLEQRLGSAKCGRRHLLSAELDAAFIWMTQPPCLRAHHPTLPNCHAKGHQLLHWCHSWPRPRRALSTASRLWLLRLVDPAHATQPPHPSSGGSCSLEHHLTGGRNWNSQELAWSLGKNRW